MPRKGLRRSGAYPHKTHKESEKILIKIVNLNNGMKVINASGGHEFNMEDEQVVPYCGFALTAIRGETPVEHTDVPDGVSVVSTGMLPQDDGVKFLKTVPEGVLVIGSIQAAQAYGHPVIALIANAETSAREIPPQDKIMSTDKIIAFW